MYPFIEKKHFVGAMFDPVEGHLDPWGVTQAYAKCATMAGAEINRFNRVVDLKPRPDGAWDVITEKGNVVAEHVVNCGGLWAREVGRMVGLELPVLAMEHHYLITEDIPGVIDPKVDKFHVIDFEGEIYMRQEGGGMLIGTYEQACQPWSERETPWDFGQNLLPNDLDRIAPSLETAFEHFPQLGKVGIRKVVNGPFTFAPDGNPLIGPVKGLKNFWVACGVMAGFSQGGGVGLALANWMIDGDPGHDIWGMDVARYRRLGDAAPTPTPRCARIIRAASASASPTRNCRPRGRCARRRSTTGWSPRTRCSANTAALENPLWFAPKGMEPIEDVTFRRSNAHDHVGAECRAVRAGVGMTEIANYGKIEVEGPRAAEFLVACDGQQAARGRQARAVADAQRARQADRRFHDQPLRAGQVPAGLLLCGRGLLPRWFERHAPATA